jgi:hypothetical protein
MTAHDNSTSRIVAKNDDIDDDDITTKSTIRVLAGTDDNKYQNRAPIMSEMTILPLSIKTFRNRRTERQNCCNRRRREKPKDEY